MLVIFSGPGIWAKPTQKMVPILKCQPPDVSWLPNGETHRISIVSKDAPEPGSK